MDVLSREQGKVVVASFDGGELTSDAGLLLLAEADRRLELSRRLSGTLEDGRQEAKVRHPAEELLRARIGAICAGYPDCNDLNVLKRDPALRLFSGRKYLDKASSELAGQSTLSRWENRITSAELVRMGLELMALAVEQLPPDTRAVVIDVDSTDDPCHGQQVLQGFNRYYNCHCFMPLLVHISAVEDGGHGRVREGRRWLAAALLRSGRCHGTYHFRAVVHRVILELRRRFPQVHIIVRCDSGFGTEKIMRFCEKRRVHFVLGLPQNEVLQRRSGSIQLKACLKYTRFRRIFSPRERRQRGLKTPAPSCAHYGTFYHQPNSWSAVRRVVVKAGLTLHPLHETPELNPRFVVTNIMPPMLNAAGRRWKACEVYRFYCQRGDQENRIKEWKLDLNSGRTSCHRFSANQFRLLPHTAAMLLLNFVQHKMPVTKKLGPLSIGTLRLHLLKVAARLTASTRRLHIQLPTSFPYAGIWLALQPNLAPPGLESP